MKTFFEISLQRMDHPSDVNYFMKQVLMGMTKGYQEFRVCLKQVNTAFPNAVVPISGMISYLRHDNIDFEIIDVPEYLTNASFAAPLIVTQDYDLLMRTPLNKVWNFHDSVEINQIVDAFLKEVSQVAACEGGVLQGLEWCLNEVMDNVLQHSSIGEGYIMGQIHKGKQNIAVCIFDPGQGIYNSLKNSQSASYTIRRPLDAITLAIKEGVTRDKRIGQGNGMWGLHNIVKLNSGTLAITSNGACYSLKGNEPRTFQDLPYFSRENGFTTIDFQIDFSKGISFVNALGGHKLINLRTEALENEQGNLSYILAEKSSGTGTRQSGERIRNEVSNIYKETGKIVELDFAGISVVSSSFADELIGKLVVEFGFARFTQIFRLKNMNDFVQPIIDRSVFQRMAELFQRSNS